MITFSTLNQCPSILRGRNLLNLSAKRLILEGYSVGYSLNLNHNTKITKWKIVEKIASAAFIFWKHPYMNLNELPKLFYWKTALTVKAVIWFMLSFAKDAKNNTQEKRTASERDNKYLQTIYKTAAISRIASWRKFTYFWNGKFHTFSFFQDCSKK